jgi:rubrerythrin
VKEPAVDLSQAIAVALEFEKKVRDHYLRGAREIADPRGRRIFAALAHEEQQHVDYLDHCLDLWTKTRMVPDAPLASLFPSGVAWVEEEARKLSAHGAERIATATEVEALRTALLFEQETDSFYEQLVAELPREHRIFFDTFLGIEDGHLALLQAQLDAVQHKGFWFDLPAPAQHG